MSPKSVLLTGGTGNLGSFILQQLLVNGSNVTAVVRSLSKSHPFLNEKYTSYVASGALKMVEIPDLSTPHAFDDVAKTVDAIIHVATPLTYTDFQKTVIDPTWKIDESILSAAAKSPSVKRVIISGSMVSTMKVPSGLFQDVVISEKNFNDITNEEALTGTRPAYAYAKTAAEHKSWAFMEAEKPDFDLVILLVPSIIGRCIHEGFVPSKTYLGGISGIYQSIFDTEKPGFLFPYFMDVEDVAAVHIQALNPDIPGNERYLFYAGLISANELANKVRETYPELRARVPSGGAGNGFPVPMVKFDTSKFEKAFGPQPQWKGWWDSAQGTVEDILKFEKPQN